MTGDSRRIAPIDPIECSVDSGDRNEKGISDQATDNLMETSDLIMTRKSKRDALRTAGIDPYPYSFSKTHSVEELTNENFARLVQAGCELAIPGRVMGLRSHGRLVFMDIGIVHHGPKIQVAAVSAELDTLSRAVLDNIDLGDWVGAIGRPMYTRTRQETIKLDHLVMLTKALRPLPNFKGQTVKDPDLLVKMPELAMIFGEKRRMLRQRATIIRTMRHVLEKRGLTEAETPYLSTFFGGG